MSHSKPLDNFNPEDYKFFTRYQGDGFFDRKNQESMLHGFFNFIRLLGIFFAFLKILSTFDLFWQLNSSLSFIFPYFVPIALSVIAVPFIIAVSVNLYNKKYKEYGDFFRHENWVYNAIRHYIPARKIYFVVAQLNRVDLPDAQYAQRVSELTPNELPNIENKLGDITVDFISYFVGGYGIANALFYPFGINPFSMAIFIGPIPLFLIVLTVICIYAAFSVWLKDFSELGFKVYSQNNEYVKAEIKAQFKYLVGHANGKQIRFSQHVMISLGLDIEDTTTEMTITVDEASPRAGDNARLSKLKLCLGSSHERCLSDDDLNDLTVYWPYLSQQERRQVLDKHFYVPMQSWAQCLQARFLGSDGQHSRSYYDDFSSVCQRIKQESESQDSASQDSAHQDAVDVLNGLLTFMYPYVSRGDAAQTQEMTPPVGISAPQSTTSKLHA